MATSEQWTASRYDWSRTDTEAMDGHPLARCVMELRARVEALEAAHQVQPSTSLARSVEAARQVQPGTRLVSYSVGPARPLEELGKDHAPVPQAPPADELVERVADAIYRNGTGDGFREEARAAIREVAATARWQRGRRQAPSTWEHVAQWLEREAER